MAVRNQRLLLLPWVPQEEEECEERESWRRREQRTGFLLSVQTRYSFKRKKINVLNRVLEF